MELTEYRVLREDCDHEGETWLYFIPQLGNEEFLDKLESIMDEEQIEDIYFISNQVLHAGTLNSMHKVTGYGCSHNILKGTMSIELLEERKDDIYEWLYKGGIYSFINVLD